MAASSPPPVARRFLSPLGRIVDALVKPHPSLGSPAEKRGARLLAGLSLVHAAAVISAALAVNGQWMRTHHSEIWPDADAVIVMVGAVLLLACYALIRSRAYRTGAILYIAVAAAMALLAPFAHGDYAEIGILASALLPVLVAAMVLRARWAALVLLGIVVGAGVQLFVTPLSPARSATGFAILLIVGVTGILVLIVRRYFGGLEQDRLTEIGDMEASLRTSEARLQTLLEHSRDMILVIGGNGAPSMVGGAYQRILGYRAEQILGSGLLDDVHQEDLERVRDALRGFLAGTRGSQTIEWRERRADGVWVWLEATATNSLNVPGVNGIVVNIRDVTERKEAEQARQRLEAQLRQAVKMESVGRLAGGVAHDFNNLLTTVQGNAEQAEELLPPEAPAHGALRAIRQATERAASLTRQLLAFSRRQVLAPRVVNLNDLLVRMEALLVRLIGEDVMLRTSLFPDLGSARLDPGLVEQIVMNLAVNARDAMPAGGTLLLETANVTLDADSLARIPVRPGEYVLLHIRDTGTGMTDEVKRHAFEPFFTTKEPGKGTGLGLATTYGAVKQSDGFIDVDSAPGAGTGIRIYFPRVALPAEKLTRPDEPRPGPGRGETILLVEDEPQVRELVMKMLARAGYRTLPAGSGEEALRVAAGHGGTIDLLMTDVVMPGMNGRDLAERLILSHPGLKVLYSSGYARDVISRHGLLEEGLSFLPKPYSSRELTRRIRAMLDEAPATPSADAPDARP